MVVALALLAPAVASAAPPPPIVVFVGPAEPPAPVAAARDALRGFARRRGTAFVDLSPTAAPSPTAALQLARGVEAYFAFRYDEALTHLNQGLTEAAATGAAGLGAPELSDLLIYRALAHTELGDAVRAWEDFVRAATVAPARRLDPARFSPTVVETFQRAVEAVAEQPPATLSLVVPAGCLQWIDARLATNIEGETLARGEHYVRVVCPGHEPFGARVEVAAGGASVRPRLTVSTPMSRDEVAAEVRARGADAGIYARATAGQTLVVGVIGADGATGDQVVVGLDEPAEAVEAVTRLYDAAATRDELVAAPSPASPARAPWHRRPWVWGVAGAALTAAVLLPFALDRTSPDGFDVRPTGQLPP